MQKISRGLRLLQMGLCGRSLAKAKITEQNPSCKALKVLQLSLPSLIGKIIVLTIRHGVQVKGQGVIKVGDLECCMRSIINMISVFYNFFFVVKINFRIKFTTNM